MLQNLREAILGYRNAIQKQADERKRQAALSNFVEYLERYYFLICFAAFLHDRSEAAGAPGPWAVSELGAGAGGVGGLLVGSASGDSTKDRFQSWMRARPELYSILRR